MPSTTLVIHWFPDKRLVHLQTWETYLGCHETLIHLQMRSRVLCYIINLVVILGADFMKLNRRVISGFLVCSQWEEYTKECLLKELDISSSTKIRQ